MSYIQNRQDSDGDRGARTPLWAVIGAPVVMFALSAGAFWGAYVWMSESNPQPGSGTAMMASLPVPIKPQVTSPETAPAVRVGPISRAKNETPRRDLAKRTAPPALFMPAERSLPPAEPKRADPSPQHSIQPPCPIQVSESRLAQGKSVLPPSGRHVAIVLHRSGNTAEGNQEVERQVIAVVNNLAPADSFTVVATAGQGSVFASEPVSPQPQSVQALRSWLKALPGGTTASLETGVSTALSMPAINKVVVVADVSPEREAETWRRLSDVVRTGNRFGAAVSAVTVTPRCTPAIAPAKGQGAGTDEPPSVARETVIAPGL